MAEEEWLGFAIAGRGAEEPSGERSLKYQEGGSPVHYGYQKYNFEGGLLNLKLYCTQFLCYLDGETDDHYRNPNN